MILQPVSSVFPCSPRPSGTWRTLGLSIPWCCLATSSSVCLVFFPPFAVPCKTVLARPDERETWLYHCSLRLFTIVRKSSCGPIACWILARTSVNLCQLNSGLTLYSLTRLHDYKYNCTRQSCRENLWTESVERATKRVTQEQNKKEWASSVGLCQT